MYISIYLYVYISIYLYIYIYIYLYIYTYITNQGTPSDIELRAHFTTFVCKMHTIAKLNEELEDWEKHEKNERDQAKQYYENPEEQVKRLRTELSVAGKVLPKLNHRVNNFLWRDEKHKQEVASSSRNPYFQLFSKSWSSSATGSDNDQ